MKDEGGAIRTQDELKRIGVQLSIDDFGSGYSSLNQLKRLPVDRLKVDRSFVSEVTSAPDDAAIVQAVIQMANVMKLSVVAEGVESDAQMLFLRNNRCHDVQGYHLSRPLPADQAGSFLSAHQP